MKISSAIRQLFFILVSSFYYFDSIGQNCHCISGTKDKNKGTETLGGLTSSADFYSLLFQKEINRKDTTVKPRYNLFLNVASRVLLSDSMLKTRGVMEVRLLDNSIMKYDSVSFHNNPLGFCCTIGFNVSLTEEEFKMIGTNPIVTLTVLDVKTSFADKKQKEQQKIINCLIGSR
jgi:hypothetical protein